MLKRLALKAWNWTAHEYYSALLTHRMNVLIDMVNDCKPSDQLHKQNDKVDEAFAGMYRHGQ
jgi:hypothetical protein